MQKDLRISVVIVAWNARAYLEECLPALFDTTRGFELDVHVVDNGSEDGTADMVANLFPRVRLVRSAENLGYARANNIALRLILDEGKTDQVLLLNSDVVLGEGAIEGLVAALEADPEAGAAAPALVLPDGKFQAGAAGALPTVGSGLSYFLFLSRLFPRLFKGFFVHQPYFAKKGLAVRLGWLSGACIILPRRALEATGLLNEEYFFYLEDVDMGRRMHDAGFAVLFVPSVRVLHHHGITYRVIRREVNTEWLGRLFAYVRTQEGRVAGAVFRATAAVGFFLRLCGRAAAVPFGKDPDRKEKLRDAAAFFTFSLTGRGNHAITP